MKMNELFRTFNMYENIEPLSDEVKVFKCEEADETSSINSALSAMSLRSVANSRCNENISTTDDIQQRLKRIHQMVQSRKESHENEQESIPATRLERHPDDDDDEEYDEEKGELCLAMCSFVHSFSRWFRRSTLTENDRLGIKTEESTKRSVYSGWTRQRSVGHSQRFVSLLFRI